MSGNAWKVYAVIALYCDWQTGEGCPTFNTISIETGLSATAIRRSIHELNDMGVISFEFRKACNKEGQEYGRKRYFYKLTHLPTQPYFRSHNKWRPS